MRVVVVVGVVMVLAAPAWADPDAASPFASLDQPDGASAAGLELVVPRLHTGALGTEQTRPTAMQVQLHAHFVDPASHLGGYLSVPVNHTDVFGDARTALGDIEIGGLYAAPTASPALVVLLHAGVFLPTASRSDEYTNFDTALFARTHDLEATIPGVTLRFGVSPLVHVGRWFGRVDLDVEQNVTTSDGNPGNPLVHVAGGVGVMLASFVVTGEVGVNYTPGNDTSLLATANCLSVCAGYQTLSAVTASVRYTGARVQPFVAVGTPLSARLRTDESALVAAGVVVRLR